MVNVLRILGGATLVLALTPVMAGQFCNQPPKAGGGTLRSSQLWVDLSGQGNDLDGDSIIYADFVLTQSSTIDHVEWWGVGACEKGFQIEFWKQDPGTIAYQPYGVFRGSGAKAEKAYDFQIPTTSSDPSGMVHYSLDLPTPVTLAANNTANPRWFLAVIGRTAQAYYSWNWSQNISGSTRCFQFVRGGHEGGGDLYRVLPEGRAMLLSHQTRISGHVALGDFDPGPLDQLVIVEVVQNDVTIESTPVYLDAAGAFSIPTAATGTAQVRVKASHWLSRLTPAVSVDNSIDVGTLALKNGDIDGDNVVSVFDYGVLSDYFDRSAADADWTYVGDNGFAPVDADLDGDSAVTVFDYGILSTNFDLVGE